MNTVSWEDFKCRCSAALKLLSASRDNPCLTEKQAELLKQLDGKDSLTENQKVERTRLIQLKDNSKKVILSSGCIEYLMEYFSWVTAGKKPVSKENLYIQYTEKGKEVEEQGITLLSLVERTYYQKNAERITNDYLSGEPDIFIGEEIMKATKITDMKCVWDYPGFLKKIHEPLNPAYDLQVKGYMDITGAREGEIAYCLVNMPEKMVDDYKRNLLHKMDVISSESPEYIIAQAELISSMYFDDIERRLRVWKIPIVPFSDFERQKLYDRVKVCRDWLFSFSEMYENLNK